jgi:hypothetical protein
VPTQDEIRQALVTNGEVLSNDLDYCSPEGFKIVLPKGYRYVSMGPSAACLVASKEGNSLIVKRLETAETPAEIVSGAIRHMRSKNPTCVSVSQRKFEPGGAQGWQAEIEMTRDGAEVKGFMACFQQGGAICHLMFFCLKSSFGANKADLEKMLNSFRPL